ncbi:MAG: hypothetical protein M2R45_04034 [Verrucomicrobia subdivision 3 bacterium]|nr:hypothetical protein [Limisphaerales bacterium]MCS1416982.1 hypothetical protein [Limisphaerales bacterium]
MKYLLSIVAALALAATSAQAGCGKKVASIGQLEKFDAATKSVTIKVVDSSDPKQVKTKTAKLTMTPNSRVIAKDKIDGLVGKKVSVVSEHGKIDYVIALASK